MGKFSKGQVIFVNFPFSNLKSSKVRPAVILAEAEFGNVILCQVTSKPYSSKVAIRIQTEDFARGTLTTTSYVRPDKIFTAETSIIQEIIGELNPEIIRRISQKIRELFK